MNPDPKHCILETDGGNRTENLPKIRPETMRKVSSGVANLKSSNRPTVGGGTGFSSTVLSSSFPVVFLFPFDTAVTSTSPEEKQKELQTTGPTFSVC